MNSPRVRAILELVSELSEEERAELLHELDGEHDVPAEEWSAAWGDELSKRIGQIERGEVQTIPLEDFLRDFSRE